MKIAIIPARGGSKRIPRKNIKSFCGKPIIAFSIEEAIASQLFDQVMVSTDDPEIAEIAKQFGAEVPFFRSPENSNDTATTVAVLVEVIKQYQANGIEIEEFCCIYPCAPFISRKLLIDSFDQFEKNQFDTVFPIVRYSTPIQRALRVDEQLVRMFSPEYASTRSQDLESAFYDAGMFYWSRKSVLIEEQKLFTNNTSFIEIPEIEAQDIDNEIDWKLAEFKYEYLQKIK